MLGEIWMAENWNPWEASSLSVSGAWSAMIWKLGSTGVVDWTTYIQLPGGLDFPHQGLCVPWVGVWRPSIPGELVRSCLAFSDLNLGGVPCHFHCMLLVRNEFPRPAIHKKDEIRLSSLGEVCKVTLQKVENKIVTIFENTVCHIISCSSNSYTWVPAEYCHLNIPIA